VDKAEKYSDSFKSPSGASVADIREGYRSANRTRKDKNEYTLHKQFFNALVSGSDELLSRESYINALKH
jgi:hypothetical protein